MIQARTNSFAGIVIDEETEEKLVVVTGGVGNGFIYLNSTEILIGSQWALGKEIIVLQFDGTLISIPNGKLFIALDDQKKSLMFLELLEFMITLWIYN